VLNDTIARLDQDAVRLGIELRQTGENTREFNIHSHRLLRYRPGGKGVILVQAYVDGELDCETVVSIERMRALLAVGHRGVTFDAAAGILTRSVKPGRTGTPEQRKEQDEHHRED
jgi:hypothetical protein